MPSKRDADRAEGKRGGERGKLWTCRGQRAGSLCCFANKLGDTVCQACGHVPPSHVSAPAWWTKAEAARGGQTSSKANGKSSAEKGSRKADESRAAERKELQQLRNKCKQLTQKLEEATAKPLAQSASDMDADETDESAELAQALAAANARVKRLRAMGADARADLSNFDEVLAEAERARDAAGEAKRAANPLKQRMAQAERYLASAQTRQASAAKALADDLEAFEKLQETIAERQQAVADAEAVVAKATVEVTHLAAQLALEKGATAAQLAPADRPPPASTAAEQGETVSLAYAEQKWVEREREFAAERAAFQLHLEQMQAVVEKAENAAKAVEEAGSDAASDAALSDLGSAADLEEDAFWTAVGKGKRRAVVARARQGTTLVKELRALGAPRPKASVSALASPFVKRAKT